MNSEIWIALGAVITAFGTNFATWFFTRKKYNSEVDNTVIENMKQSLEFYTKLSDDNKERLEEALKRNDQLEDEVRELRKQVSELMLNICYDMSCNRRQKASKRSAKKESKKEDNN